MKAIVLTKYGLPDLRIEEVEKPIPKDKEVLVAVHASSITVHNLGLVRGKPFFIRLMGNGLLRPKVKIPGSDMSRLFRNVPFLTR
jgi:NADPH:quinone reductase-like Zn-dependent oxidoreductase